MLNYNCHSKFHTYTETDNKILLLVDMDQSVVSLYVHT